VEALFTDLHIKSYLTRVSNNNNNNTDLNIKTNLLLHLRINTLPPTNKKKQHVSSCSFGLWSAGVVTVSEPIIHTAMETSNHTRLPTVLQYCQYYLSFTFLDKPTSSFQTINACGLSKTRPAVLPVSSQWCV
jgi:hypothetical protein